jgi:hypothetical protein
MTLVGELLGCSRSGRGPSWNEGEGGLAVIAAADRRDKVRSGLVLINR